jgi:ornithine--oxo-acid transaminase
MNTASPTALSQHDLIALEDQYGAHNYKPLDIVVASAQGAWVTDVDGNKYLDCLSAYSAVNQGHCHPKILATLVEQAQKVTLSSRAFRNDQLPLFYETLCQLTGYESAIPMNSGAEAVETAVKLGRSTRKDIKLGICGEHGGEPDSVKFCHRLGLAYVSCSPFRLPVARLAAAQAALKE